MMPPLHIVLYQPEIPANTGNIIRLCFLNKFRLHLIEPLGFSLDDAALRRAGIDYWAKFRSDVEVYSDWESFVAKNPSAEANSLFFTAHTSRNLWDAEYPETSWLVFGRETSGLPAHFHHQYATRLVTIPKRGSEGRSLNLSNAVAVAAYEGLRRMPRG